MKFVFWDMTPISSKYYRCFGGTLTWTTLKIEAASFFETSLTIHQYIRSLIPKDLYFYRQNSENCKPRNLSYHGNKVNSYS